MSADNDATIKYERDNRLERIERKIDDLSEAFIILARTEEKLATIERDRIEFQARFNRMELRLDAIHAKVEESNNTTSIINKIFWLVVVGGIGGIVAKLTNML
jgi:hypothetical protein